MAASGFAQKVRFGLILSIFNGIKPSILYSILNIWAKPPQAQPTSDGSEQNVKP
jgi:hypothetical protein